jgi:hyperosmotically inducible protein
MTERQLLQPLLILTLCATLATACTRSEPPDAVVVETAAVPDDRLETYVQARYQAVPEMRAHDIGVTVSNGVVTLRGTVPTADARQQAVTLAQQVSGVRSVDDQLQVRPASEADAARAAGTSTGDRTTTASGADNDRSPVWIATKIQAQYFLSPEIKPWNVDVTTNSAGVVTLRGEVAEAADRDAAVRIARETEGVTRVENQLRVKGGPRAESSGAAAVGSDPQAGDAWLTAKVQAKFFVDPDVKGRNIDVDTTNGAVTLRGEVESEAERRRALAIARSTEGVQSVTDQLQVRRTASDTPTPAREAAAAIDDAWITTKIQSQYFLDQLVKGRNIVKAPRSCPKSSLSTSDSGNAAQFTATNGCRRRRPCS